MWTASTGVLGHQAIKPISTNRKPRPNTFFTLFNHIFAFPTTLYHHLLSPLIIRGNLDQTNFIQNSIQETIMSILEQPCDAEIKSRDGKEHAGEKKMWTICPAFVQFLQTFIAGHILPLFNFNSFISNGAIKDLGSGNDQNGQNGQSGVKMNNSSPFYLEPLTIDQVITSKLELESIEYDQNGDQERDDILEGGEDSTTTTTTTTMTTPNHHPLLSPSLSFYHASSAITIKPSTMSLASPTLSSSHSPSPLSPLSPLLPQSLHPTISHLSLNQTPTNPQPSKSKPTQQGNLPIEKICQQAAWWISHQGHFFHTVYQLATNHPHHMLLPTGFHLVHVLGNSEMLQYKDGPGHHTVETAMDDGSPENINTAHLPPYLFPTLSSIYQFLTTVVTLVSGNSAQSQTTTGFINWLAHFVNTTFTPHVSSLGLSSALSLSNLQIPHDIIRGTKASYFQTQLVFALTRDIGINPSSSSSSLIALLASSYQRNNIYWYTQFREILLSGHQIGYTNGSFFNQRTRMYAPITSNTASSSSSGSIIDLIPINPDPEREGVEYDIWALMSFYQQRELPHQNQFLTPLDALCSHPVMEVSMLFRALTERVRARMIMTRGMAGKGNGDGATESLTIITLSHTLDELESVVEQYNNSADLILSTIAKYQGIIQGEVQRLEEFRTTAVALGLSPTPAPTTTATATTSTSTTTPQHLSRLSELIKSNVIKNDETADLERAMNFVNEWRYTIDIILPNIDLYPNHIQTNATPTGRNPIPKPVCLCTTPLWSSYYLSEPQFRTTKLQCKLCAYNAIIDTCLFAKTQQLLSGTMPYKALKKSEYKMSPFSTPTQPHLINLCDPVGSRTNWVEKIKDEMSEFIRGRICKHFLVEKAHMLISFSIVMMSVHTNRNGFHIWIS
jgi:hypothetical protein